MKTELLKLKIRLKLKKLTRQINKEVEWNFGYSPDDTAFDLLVDQRDELENIAKDMYPDIYKQHRKAYDYIKSKHRNLP